MTTDEKWTTEVPTEPGKYWAYEALDPLDADVMLVELKGEGNKIFISLMHNMPFPAHHFSHFHPFSGFDEKPLPPADALKEAE